MQRSPVVALGGVLVAVVLSGCTIVNLGVVTLSPTPSAGPPTTSATVSPSPSTTSASPTPDQPAFGPDGFGALTLGMTKAQANATGLVKGVIGTVGTCGAPRDGHLAGAEFTDRYDLTGKLFFSMNTNKLVIISAMDGVSTPENITLGSTTAEVRSAYPAWKGYQKAMNGVGYVKAPGGDDTYYRIEVDDGRVDELTLMSADQDCAE